MTNKKLETLRKMPLIQTKVRRLKGTSLVLHQTIISDIRPIEYYEAICDRNNKNIETQIDGLMEGGI